MLNLLAMCLEHLQPKEDTLQQAPVLTPLVWK